MNPFDLTPAQKKLFNKLKKAYNDCIKANMYPANIYSNLTFYNGEFISHYGDNYDIGGHHDTGHHIQLHGNSRSFNSIRIAGEFADDNHVIFLTDKGAAALKEWDEE